MSARRPASGGSQTRRWVTAFMVLAIAVMLLALPLWDVVLSGLLLVELFRPLRPGPITWGTSGPQEFRVAFSGRRRTMEANLYIPAGWKIYRLIFDLLRQRR